MEKLSALQLERQRGVAKMAEVILHVYDVTNCGSEKTNNTILQINKIFKDGMGLGGVFHSAVQVLALLILLLRWLIESEIGLIRQIHVLCIY